MAYSIQHFKPEINQPDPLQLYSRTEIVNSDSLLFISGAQSSFEPNVWSTLLCDEFRKKPSNFIRKSWLDMSFLNSARSRFDSELIKFKLTLSPEKLFVLEHQYAKNPKSGSSFISIKMETNKIKYNMLGDNFLFIYDTCNGDLFAYSSMIAQDGTLDLSQPCHCLYNDLSFIGSPLIGEKTIKNCICFIMSRELADWFIKSYKANQKQTIISLLSLKDNDEYNKLLIKIQSQQSYNKIPFDKDLAHLLIIKPDKEHDRALLSLKPLFSWVKRHIRVLVIFLTVILSILCVFFIIHACRLDNPAVNDNAEIDIPRTDAPSQTMTSGDIKSNDDYEFYRNLLNNHGLSFDEVREMMEFAEKHTLNVSKKELFDTLSAYYEFVNLYNGEVCYLNKALSILFQNVENGKYKVIDHLGNELLETDMTDGKITYFSEIHQRMIVELFIGKYYCDGTIIQYDDEVKRENYKKAVNSHLDWGAFSDMK